MDTPEQKAEQIINTLLDQMEGILERIIEIRKAFEEDLKKYE
jgi:hypothetical protein